MPPSEASEQERSRRPAAATATPQRPSLSFNTLTAPAGQVEIEIGGWVAENFAEPTHGRTGLVSCEFSQIESPGLYVETRTGALLRIREDGIVPGRSPVIQAVARDPWVVTKISEDPYLPLTKARMIAANLDIEVNF